MTREEVIKACPNLSGANLRYANLSYANLSGANLRCANLSGANLSGANLRYANLRYANLRYADLRDADLYDADLYGTNLSGATLPKPFKITRIDFGRWSVCITPKETCIGCQKHANEKWLRWTPKDVRHFAEGAEEWWASHQRTIKAAIREIMQ